MSVLLDTGVLYAFLNADDTRHEEARSLIQRVAKGELGASLVSTLIAAELLTLVRVRTKSVKLERAAISLLPMPDPALPGLRLLHVDSSVLLAATPHFQKHRSRGLSFTDATHLALMASHDITRLATFDRGFRGLVKVVDGAA